MGKVDYTVLSKDMGEPVSRGRSAEIYPFGEDRVVKLYFPDFPESDVDLEFHNTVEAFKQGCTPMECFGKVRSGDRFGIILKRLDGISLTKMPEKNPLILFKAGKLIASEHARVQKCDGSALTDLREKAAKCLDGEMFGFLSDADRKKIADYILALPAVAAEVSSTFNAAFEKGDFKAAAAGYEKQLNPAAPAPNVLYNLASAYCANALFSTSNGYRENATYTNRAFIDYLTEHEAGPTGIVLMDYAGVDQSQGYNTGTVYATLGKELTDTLIANNFKYLTRRSTENYERVMNTVERLRNV